MWSTSRVEYSTCTKYSVESWICIGLQPVIAAADILHPPAGLAGRSVPSQRSVGPGQQPDDGPPPPNMGAQLSRFLVRPSSALGHCEIPLPFICTIFSNHGARGGRGDDTTFLSLTRCQRQEQAKRPADSKPWPWATLPCFSQPALSRKASDRGRSIRYFQELGGRVLEQVTSTGPIAAVLAGP